MSVGTLLGLPKARGLFQKAIPQSGACSTANTRERAAKIARALRGEARGRAATRTRCSRASTERLLQAQAALAPAPGAVVDAEIGGMPLQPVVDGEVQPRLALESLARGSAAGVPRAGRHDARGVEALHARRSDELHAHATRRCSRAASAAWAPRRAAWSRRTARRAASAAHAVTAPELWSAIETDRIFRMPGAAPGRDAGRRTSRASSATCSPGRRR